MKESTRIFISPRRYVQGPGTIHEIADQVSLLGDRALVIGGKTGLSATREGRNRSFAGKKFFQMEEQFRGEVSDAEINRIAEIAKRQNCNVIIACGGGKSIDTGKVVAANCNVPITVVPTAASSDAPCSSISVIYKDNGIFDRLMFLNRNPELVLVDTEIICKAPPRLLAAGMGDALATWFEAEACRKSSAINIPGGQATATAVMAARLCYDLLMEYGLQAKIACENKVVTTAFDKVVEANTLLSCLGFESVGTASAHGLSEGLSIIKEMHDFFHGEKVAFCTLVQLIMEGQSKEILEDVFGFCYKVGLPVTLADLKSDKVNRTMLREAADVSAEPGRNTHNHSFLVNGEMIYDAIITADAMGTEIKAGQPIT